MRHEQLQCEVVRLSYNFTNATGHIYFPPCNCCDMVGCIEYFRKIDPNVKCIQTYSGSKADTYYIFDNGEWHACGYDR